ncbi:MAG TPA: hypothetical protein ENK23_01210 [Sorangium sp.]|nr:hypothetical protein [Sorangium sp.]
MTLVGAMMLAPARSSAVPLADAAQSDAAQSDAAQSDAAQSDAVALKKSRARGKGLRQQRSTRYMRVVARSLRLTEKARGRLLRIAERYFDDTGRKLVITGGDRTARGQARLMYKKLERGEDLIKLYARDDLVTEIMDAYEGGKADGLGTNGIVRAMAAVIKDQMANDQYVSRHLQFTAADVRSRRMTEEQHAAFVRAVRAEPGVRLVDERDTASPHLHLNL